jgi:hypothetical protein
MFYKGKEIKTIRDIMDIIDEVKTPEEAEEFMNAYREDVGKRVADSNIGYLSGYYPQEDMIRIQKLFGVQHPLFGDKVLSPQEAFELGLKEAKKIDNI